MSREAPAGNFGISEVVEGRYPTMTEKADNK